MSAFNLLTAIPHPAKNPRNQNLKKWKNCWRCHFTYVYQKPQTYEAWFLRWSETDIFLSFWAIFLPFYPTNNPENQNFEKINKAYEDVIILYMCTKNHDHMVYMLPEIWVNPHDFLSFWNIFALLPDYWP